MIEFAKGDIWLSVYDDLPAAHRKKLTVDFEGGNRSSDAGLLLREAESASSGCAGGLRKRCRIAAIRTASGMRCRTELEILDVDDTFCAAHGGQQLPFRCPRSRPALRQSTGIAARQAWCRRHVDMAISLAFLTPSLVKAGPIG
jgi:hypothetical protein